MNLQIAFLSAAALAAWPTPALAQSIAVPGSLGDPVTVALDERPVERAGPPLLTHGPIALGQPIDLEVSGVPSRAQVDLYFSSASGRMNTGIGTFELGCWAMRLVGDAYADPDGKATFHFDTPLDPRLAEMPMHFQAVVKVDGEERALTNALQLRLLGSRAYVGVQFPATGFGVLQVFSALDGALLFERADATGDQTAPSGADDDHLPMIAVNGDHSRAAWVAGDHGLVIFDNFFGGKVAELRSSGLAPRLLTDASGKLLYALDERADLIWKLDFATGDVLGALPLTAPVSEVWTGDPEGGLAFVATLPGDARGAGVLSVDLARMEEVEYVDLLPSRWPSAVDAVDDLVWTGAELLVVGTAWTEAPPVPGMLPDLVGLRARVEVDARGAVVANAVTLDKAPYQLLLDHYSGQAVVASLSFERAGELELDAMAMSDPELFVPFVRPPDEARDVVGWTFCGRRLWMLCSEAEAGGDYAELWSCDLGSPGWAALEPGACLESPTDCGMVEDGLAERVLMTAPRGAGTNCGTSPAELVAYDLDGRGGWTAELAALPVLLETIVFE